jgi:hypothetical protein
VIVEHPEVPPGRILAAVRQEWGIDADTVEHLELPREGWQWLVGDGDGPQWFASLDLAAAAERRQRASAFECAAMLRQELGFVLAPVYTRDARIAVDLPAGLQLSLTPYLDRRTAGPGGFADDAQRGVVAGMLGALHRQPRPRRVPVWRPRLGHGPAAGRADLEMVLDQQRCSGGPWSEPTGRLLGPAREALRRALRRFDLLGAAVVGTTDRWVLTHGRPGTDNLVLTPDGPRLTGWEALAFAPRERDLYDVLGAAEGAEPWFAYIEAGGRPDPLSADTVELFDLERHLTAVTALAVRFCRPHGDSADERRRFAELEESLGAVRARWG